MIDQQTKERMAEEARKGQLENRAVKLLDLLHVQPSRPEVGHTLEEMTPEELRASLLHVVSMNQQQRLTPDDYARWSNIDPEYVRTHDDYESWPEWSRP